MEHSEKHFQNLGSAEIVLSLADMYVASQQASQHAQKGGEQPSILVLKV